MPGVVAIHNGSAVQEFFVSGGFATIDGANAHVTVAEAVPVETIDGAAVAAGAIPSWLFVSLFLAFALVHFGEAICFEQNPENCIGL